MWAANTVASFKPHIILPVFAQPSPPSSIAVSAHPLPRNTRRETAGFVLKSAVPQATGDQSRTLTSAAADKTTAGRRDRARRRGEEEKGGEKPSGRELTGSAVLMAMQKAAARARKSDKNKKKKKTMTAAEANLVRNEKKKNGEEGEGEDGNGGSGGSGVVRPVRVKSDWARRLQELETRLRSEFPDF